MPKTLTTSSSTSAFVDASRLEVTRRFRDRDDTTLTFHCLEHTEDVASAVDLIGRLEDLTPEELEELKLAAWWHDVGMLTDEARGHERRSAAAASEFLREQGYPPERLEVVERIILATDMTHAPQGLLESIIRDADLSGLGRPDYRARLENLRKEWAAKGGNVEEDRREWLEKNIKFLHAHNYHTPAANRLYDEQKRINIALLEKRLAKRIKKAAKKARKAKSKSIKSAISSEKSAQMMLKTTLRNNIDLTSIADGKANIMLSINAAIIALGMPLLAAYIPEYTYLAIPGGVLLLTCILTIYYATLATRPVKSDGITDLSKLDSGSTNLFFFGNYYNMPVDKYKQGLEEVLQRQDLLDDSVMNDLYYLGVTLGEKFNRLRICYAIFLVGMVIAAIAFVVTFYIGGPLNGSEIPANLYNPTMDSIRH